MPYLSKRAALPLPIIFCQRTLNLSVAFKFCCLIFILCQFGCVWSCLKMLCMVTCMLIVQNRRQAKLLTVSYHQDIDSCSTSSSRSGPLTSYDPQRILASAFELIKKSNTSSAGGSDVWWVWIIVFTFSFYVRHEFKFCYEILCCINMAQNISLLLVVRT